MIRQMIGCIFFSTVLIAPVRADDPLEKAIDKLVAKYGVTTNGPGIAILISEPGRVSFQKGYGLARIKDRTPITPHTLFELASVTKPFTATAVLVLHDRGKLSIQDDVRKYVPELPEYSKNRPIRIADLLQQVSGLPDYVNFGIVPARHKTYWVNEDYAGAFAKQGNKVRLAFPTGSKFEYNNTNYMLLGLIVQRVTKKSFGAVLHDEVFVPAGMTHSFVYESPTSVPKRPAGDYELALGYQPGKTKGAWSEGWGAPPYRDEELLTVGDGGVWTNLVDAARWDAALRAGKLLKPATIKLALAPSRTRDGKTNPYGFGWSLYFGGAGKMNGYGHDGDWRGFRTSYYKYLAADRTTVILSNQGDFDTDKFWYDLNDAIEKSVKAK